MRLSSRLLSARAVASRPQRRVLEMLQARLGPARPDMPPPPAPQLVADAIQGVAAERNGYQAWSLFVALRQGDVTLPSGALDALAGAMLHVDTDLYADVAARRVLSVLDGERQAGHTPSRQLLAHSAAACALRGLAELAEALCLETESRGRGNAPDLELRSSLIAAHGVARQLPQAFAEYRALEAQTGRRPPARQPALALLSACASAGDLDRGFALLDELRRTSGFRVAAGAIAPLIRGCAQLGDAERAAELLELAQTLRIDVRAAAVREFARTGMPEFLRFATRLHREALSSGSTMPVASTTKLARACLSAGDAASAEEVIMLRAQREGRHSDGEHAVEELNTAFDLLHSIARQDEQWENTERDIRRTQRTLLGGT